MYGASHSAKNWSKVYGEEQRNVSKDTVQFQNQEKVFEAALDTYHGQLARGKESIFSDCVKSAQMQVHAALESKITLERQVANATTKIYTYVDQVRLRKIHKKFHPRP